MTEREDYSALVGKAEKAVAGVKDPELRRIAFQKVLEDLLAGGGTQYSHKSSVSKVHTTSRNGASSKKGGPTFYIKELLEEGFFKKPKTIAHLKAELENRGHHIPLTSLSGPLQTMCKERKLRRQRVNTSGNKQTFAYSNW